MLNNNNSGGIFQIDPSIVKDNLKASTIHENYSETYGLSELGFRRSVVRRNLSPTVLIEKAIRNGEGILTDTGALAVTTGKFTGRSPHDKYIVDTDGIHDAINWGDVNHPISRDVFDAIKTEMIGFLNGNEVYVFDGFAGAVHRQHALLHRHGKVHDGEDGLLDLAGILGTCNDSEMGFVIDDDCRF